MPDTAKILVISDVHGRLRDLRWVLQNEPADALFFLGDGLYDLDTALELRKTPLPCPVYRVRGNCDVGYPDPAEGLAPFAGGAVLLHPRPPLRRQDGAPTAWPRPPGARAAPTWRCSATPMCGNCSAAPAAAAAVFNPGSLRDGRSYGVVTVDRRRVRIWMEAGVPEF